MRKFDIFLAESQSVIVEAFHIYTAFKAIQGKTLK